ncbi:MAG: glycerophosphodiester phosphodiesterase [Pseudonocardia sp.]|nr:glycerophosphodiester phosphodiesterase [Pseudonocardia sp.]
MPFPVETEPTARPPADAVLELPLTTQLPLIIGHRGASGYRPEHTLPGYELAARLGADFLEPDLVSTGDGVLVARHEPEIGGTTDVAAHPEFADRRCTKLIDGQPRHGWFAEDFTLAELRTLRAVERVPDIRAHNTRFDGRFGVPTFEEVLALAVRLSEELGRTIGVYPETKNPGYHTSIGLALEPPLVRHLRDAGVDRPDAAVFVQSFETSNLRELAAELKVPLVQLVNRYEPPADLVAAGVPADHRTLLCPEGLREMAEYAAVVAPDKNLVVTPEGEPTTLLPDAHAAGLRVHPYTFRNENRFLPESLRSEVGPNAHGDAVAELARFLRLGVDAVFADHPDTAVFARAEHLTAG